VAPADVVVGGVEQRVAELGDRPAQQNSGAGEAQPDAADALAVCALEPDVGQRRVQQPARDADVASGVGVTVLTSISNSR
jgi:hypothetical protein